MLDRERSGTYVVLVLAELALVAAFAGVLVALLIVTRDEPLWLRALGVGTVAMATCGLVVWVVEAAARWSWSVRRPVPLRPPSSAHAGRLRRRSPTRSS